MVPSGLPLSVNITMSFFRGVRPYKTYYLCDEVCREYESSPKIDEKDYYVWTTKWLNGDDPCQC